MSADLHPVAELFPALSEDEYAVLRQSIAANGVLVPAVVDADGRIVDGRHRAEIAADLGKPLPTEPLPDGVSPWDFAAGVNLARRNLDEQQRVAILLLAERQGQAPEVAKIRKTAKARKRANSPKATDVPNESAEQFGNTSDQIGALVEVSGSTVRRVETAEKVHPGALEQIAQGEKTAQKIIGEKTKKAAAALDVTPAVMKRWREAFKAIDGNIHAGALNGSADRLTAKEIELIRDATPRLVEALSAFAAAVTTSTQLSVVNGGRS